MKRKNHTSPEQKHAHLLDGIDHDPILRASNDEMRSALGEETHGSRINTYVGLVNADAEHNRRVSKARKIAVKVVAAAVAIPVAVIAAGNLLDGGGNQMINQREQDAREHTAPVDPAILQQNQDSITAPYRQP